jgi:mannose-6-phosphate isomerase-like protein (cupin superfamily)
MAIVSGTGMVGLVDQMVELAQGPFFLQPARVMQGVENERKQAFAILPAAR